MIQNKTIHYWKLGRDELLLARRNPEIKKSRRRVLVHSRTTTVDDYRARLSSYCINNQQL